MYLTFIVAESIRAHDTFRIILLFIVVNLAFVEQRSRSRVVLIIKWKALGLSRALIATFNFWGDQVFSDHVVSKHCISWWELTSKLCFNTEHLCWRENFLKRTPKLGQKSLFLTFVTSLLWLSRRAWLLKHWIQYLVDKYFKIHSRWFDGWHFPPFEHLGQGARQWTPFLEG